MYMHEEKQLAYLYNTNTRILKILSDRPSVARIRHLLYSQHGQCVQLCARNLRNDLDSCS